MGAKTIRMYIFWMLVAKVSLGDLFYVDNRVQRDSFLDWSHYGLGFGGLREGITKRL